MKKSLILCSLLIAFAIDHSHAQATDSTITNNNTFADKPATKNQPVTNDEFSVTTGLKIYPNPVRDMLQIEGLDASVKTQISVSSFYGKIIFQGRSSGSATYSANVGKLKPGIYYVTVKENRKSILLKFIKE